MLGLEQVQFKLREGLALLIQQDRHLLENSAQERAITGALTCHLRTIFRPWDVDTEYNIDGGDRKKNPSGNSWMAPDIIIHQRGRLGPNLLVIQAKFQGCREDEQKKDQDSIYHCIDRLKYRFGLFLLIPRPHDLDFTLHWWQEASSGGAERLKAEAVPFRRSGGF